MDELRENAEKRVQDAQARVEAALRDRDASVSMRTAENLHRRDIGVAAR